MRSPLLSPLAIQNGAARSERLVWFWSGTAVAAIVATILLLRVLP